MNLHRLYADLRKTASRLRRRSASASQQQVDAWKRRLATLIERLRLVATPRLRRALMASALLLGSTSALRAISLPVDPSGNGNFRFVVDGKQTLPTRFGGSDDYCQAGFGDVDGDGDWDAILVSEYSNIRYFKNIGNVRAPRWQEMTGTDNPMSGYSNSADYGSVSIVDLDGDGDLDVVMGDYSVRYFKNTGTKTAPVFVEQSGIFNPFNSISDVSAVTLGDLDGDGDLDLVYGDYSSYQILSVTNTGSKTNPDFTAAPTDLFHGTYMYDYAYPQLGDLDGDGDLDLVIGVYYYGDFLYTMTNTGTRRNPDFTGLSVVAGLYNDGFTTSLVDIDGDGDLDVYSGDEDDGFNLWENVGSSKVAAFSQPIQYDYIGDNDLLADMDGDGDLDWVSTNRSLRNDNGRMVDLEIATGNDPLSYIGGSGRAMFDFDGDGDNDLISVYSGSISYYRNVSGVFTQLTGGADPFSGATTSNDRYATVGDVDGDGDADLLFYDNGSHSFFQNTGTAAAPAFTLVTGSTDPFDNLAGSSSMKPFLMDLDGDGDLDLALLPENSGTSAESYRNVTANTPMTQLSGTDDPFNGVAFPNSYGSLYAVDFDHDGDLDFKVYDYNAQGVWWKLMNNLPRFTKVDAVAAAKGKILIGPVPAKQGDDLCLYVDQVTDHIEVDVFNAAGEKVLSGLNSLGTIPCIRADMAPGLYWARITSNGRTTTQKLIITAK